MPNATFNAAGAATSGLATLTPALPAGFLANDFHLLVVQTSNQDPGAIAGWQRIGALVGSGVAAAAGSVGLALYWRAAVAGDTAPTVPDSGDHQVAQIVGFRNVDIANPIHQSASNTAATTTAVSTPAVTTTIPNCVIVGFNANAVDIATVQCTSFANATLTGVATFATASSNTTSGTGGGVQGAYGLKAVAGASGSFTATQATTSVQARFTVALKPADDLTPQSWL